jgi:DNA sulfur modification protein DndD
MKLLRARFENFRLLRDLEMQFSVDAEKNLTVIRAENETGKTTMLTALQWAFYGDEALPAGGKNFRLHPIDSSKGTVRTTVEVDFETASPMRSDRVTPAARRYRVVRSVTETIGDGSWKRGEPSLKLYELTSKGAQPQEYADSRLRIELPPELREVFFTDGDRALSFIEADSATVKRQRVEKAIKALLGLSIVEDATKHVKQVAAEVNKRVRESDASAKVKAASARIAELDEELAKLEPDMEAAIADRQRCEEQYEKLSRQIEAALVQGDRSELVQELQEIRAMRKREDAMELSLAKEQGELLKSKTLAKQLLSTSVAAAASMLEDLKERGRIPNQTIPVLADTLEEGTCICGETLDAADADGAKRRKHIEHLIEDSRTADAVQKLVTELYYGARDLMEPVEGEGWKSEYSGLCDRRYQVSANLKDLGTREAAIQAKIDAMPDIDIQRLREQKRVAKTHADEYADKAVRLRTRIDTARQEKLDAEKERDQHLKEETKGLLLSSELTVSQDLLGIFDRSLERLKSDELKRVSSLMNDIFLEMIGADTEQNAIIRRAEISAEFDILVFGPEERTLDPDKDLNGASRRALTLAFILALTQVSGVEAPNIIDTPLGMMSGYVKSAVLKAAVRHSSQLILFLTRSEIAGTEAILAEKAGIVTTLTNPAHYPRMLLNKPETTDMRVVRCDCSYDESCTTCARKMEADEAPKLEAAE